MTPKQLALTAASALDAKKGEQLKILRTTEISSLADYFVICTGTSNTHVKTLCDAVEEAMDKAGESAIHREGHRSGTWVLLDFGCVIVHVFTAETRNYYDLERLWRDAVEEQLTTEE